MAIKIPPFTPVPIQPTNAEPFSTLLLLMTLNYADAANLPKPPNCTTAGFALQWNGTNWLCNSVGVAGPAGPTGPTGPTGPQGPQGPQGPGPIIGGVITGAVPNECLSSDANGNLIQLNCMLAQ